ncbi:uncharacterized protein LOC144576960 [Callithrix jacchus]
MTRAPQRVSDGRPKGAGTGRHRGASRILGRLSGLQNAPESENGRCGAGLFPQSGFENGERPRGPGKGRGTGVFTASEVHRGQGCSRTQRSSASPPRNCQCSPGSRPQQLSPLRSPGEGGDTKAPRPSQSESPRKKSQEEAQTLRVTEHQQEFSIHHCLSS